MKKDYLQLYYSLMQLSCVFCTFDSHPEKNIFKNTILIFFKGRSLSRNAKIFIRPKLPP